MNNPPCTVSILIHRRNIELRKQNIPLMRFHWDFECLRPWQLFMGTLSLKLRVCCLFSFVLITFSFNELRMADAWREKERSMMTHQSQQVPGRMNERTSQTSSVCHTTIQSCGGSKGAGSYYTIRRSSSARQRWEQLPLICSPNGILSVRAFESGLTLSCSFVSWHLWIPFISHSSIPPAIWASDDLFPIEPSKR